jgi:signal transduction histidine kinase
MFCPTMIVFAWAPAVLITVLHYATGGHHHWHHDIFRRLCYLPIIVAAFCCGLRGGLVLAVTIAVAYSPHAFIPSVHITHQDPAAPLEKALELALYVVVGALTGILVDRQHRKEDELADTASKLGDALEQQRRTADQLVRAGRLAALGEMVAGIAHEIKNPLHALRGTAEVVDTVVPKEAPQHAMWALHKKEIDRLEAVAERFLTYARPSPLERQMVDLRSVIERTGTLISAQARSEHVEVIVDGGEGEPPQTLADEQHLIQVLLNISLNGLQAIQGGGELRFRLSQQRRGEQRFHVISVSNSGPPIPEGDLERIFDPFYTTKSDGVGLGLSIATRIVEQHGGFIEVKNESPRGVMFSVLLPAPPRRPARAADPRRARSAGLSDRDGRRRTSRRSGASARRSRGWRPCSRAGASSPSPSSRSPRERLPAGRPAPSSPSIGSAP